MISILLLFLLLAIVLLSACITVLVPHMKKNRTIKLFIVCQSCVIVWIVCHIMDLFAPDLHVQKMVHWIGYLAISMLAFCFLLFALLYSRIKLAKNKVFIFCLFVFSITLYILLPTNSYHHLYFSKYGFQFIENGPFFYINIAFTYLLILIGMLVLLVHTIRSNKKKTLQIALISIAAVIPIFFNLISITNLVSLPYDLTPASFVISSLLMFIAIYRFDFIFIMPMAVNKIMKEMPESVMVVDQNQKITYINKSFKNAFPALEVDLYRSNIKEFTTYLGTCICENQKSLLVKFKEEHIFDLEIELFQPDRVIYQIKKQSVYNRYKEASGAFYLIADITEYKEFTEKLQLRNQQLIQMNLLSQELAIEKEQARIAQELHDSLGHTLISVMTLLKLAKLESHCNKEKTYLQQALTISEKALEEVRQTVSGIAQKGNTNIQNCLRALILEVQQLNIKVELVVQGKEQAQFLFAKDTIYSITREMITNAIRHGKAKEVNIIVKFKPEEIALYIIDNGIGCNTITANMGLKGIQKKVDALCGKINFYSEMHEGFRTDVIIPVKKEIV